jgi:putative Mn2+ efflux pump MntP
MTFAEVFLISLGLSMDCFAVALSFGSRKHLTRKDIIRISLFFGIFQGFMPLLGWLAGGSVSNLINSADHWIAFALLGSIGLRMVIQSLKKGEIVKQTDIRNLHVLFTLSIATSIDALVIGVTFGLTDLNIWKIIALITVVTFAVSYTGAKIGEKTSIIPAKRAELVGGLVLMGIGLKILIEHLMGAGGL